jgi:hypothetical protein
LTKVLHFYYGSALACRLQRALQSNLNVGFDCALYVWSDAENDKFWIPGADKVPVEYFKRDRRLAYLFPALNDFLGLKRVFKEFKCDLVHAHNLECAFYAFQMGLPVVFDDWEFHWIYYRLAPEVSFNRLSLPLRWYRNVAVKSILRSMFDSVPFIVTNSAVAAEYERLGVESVGVIPNVPLRFERDYAFAVDVPKREKVSSCYIGKLTRDSHTVLRNTSGLVDLWQKHGLGDLYAFEGENYCSHLNVLRLLRSFHFNLLFWKPIEVHKYYLQNKAFLASVVGVPTIITSSLSATVNLLGEYALVVDQLEEIPTIIRNYDFSRKYSLREDHLWEFYESTIKKAYDKVNAK